MTNADPLLRLHGRGRALGEAHGAQRRTAIARHIEAWTDALAAGGIDDPHVYVARFLAESNYEPEIRAHVPDLLDEIHGIAAGAGVDPLMLFALQLLDEEWAWRARSYASVDRDKCSSLALLGHTDQPTWIAQNMDLGAYTDGLQVILHIAGDDHQPTQLVFSLAGMLGLMGVNAAGIGLCCNSLPQLPSAPYGVPVAFIVRRILQSESFDEAVDVVRTIPHATNQHYLIAAAGRVVSLEASAAGVHDYRPVDASRIFHTNHPLATAGGDWSARYNSNSHARLGALRQRLANGEVDFDAIVAALTSCDDPAHPVCRRLGVEPGFINFTTGSIITALAHDARVVPHLTIGPPRPEGYAAYVL
jgi:hypothetical protein